MVFFQHHSLRPGSELFSFSRTSSVWSGALNHSTKEYTTGVMCFWPILAIRLDQLDRYDVLKVSAGSPLHASELYLWKCENHIRIKYIDIVSECAYNGYADTVSEMCEMIRYIR